MRQPGEQRQLYGFMIFYICYADVALTPEYVDPPLARNKEKAATNAV